MWQTLITALVPVLVVAIVTALLTVKLSLKQFRTQRWWERKADAYARIIESLHHLIDYCDAHEKEDREGFRISEDRKKQLEEAYSSSYDNLIKAANVGGFIISEEAASVLDKLRGRDKGDWQSEPAREIYARDARAYRAALAEIRSCAKKDLNVD